MELISALLNFILGIFSLLLQALMAVFNFILNFFSMLLH